MPSKKNWEPRIKGDLAYIPLSQGKWAVIDLVDLPLVRDHTWHARAHGNTFYAQTYVHKADGSKTTLQMHRLIFGLQPGDPGLDHINHNGLDNRRSNLRPATVQQNQQNQRLQQGCSSQYKGVYWNSGKWKVHITSDGKKHHLGYFTDEEEAARAYDEAAREHFGEYAYLNLATKSRARR